MLTKIFFSGLINLVTDGPHVIPDDSKRLILDSSPTSPSNFKMLLHHKELLKLVIRVKQHIFPALLLENG